MTPTTSRLPVSVIIITNRTDERFGKCLESVQWAEEVLVIASGPDCDLEPWHRRARFTVAAHIGLIANYSQVRNQALTHATQPWVFWLDSDEVVTPSSLPELERVISLNQCDGVEVIRQDVFYGSRLKWGEAGQMYLLRLAKRSRIKFSRPIHEVAQVTGSVCQSRILIEHYSHPDLNEFWHSIVRYAKIEAHYRATMNWPFSRLELVVWPVGKLFFNLFVRLGILDGWRGIIYATMMSLHSLLVRVYLYELYEVSPAHSRRTSP